MKAYVHVTPEGDEFQLRIIQSLDDDLMFGPTRYTLSAERGADGFEIKVDVAPGYYHFLSAPARMNLQESALTAAYAALDTGLREPADVSIGSTGAVRLHARTIARLL